MHDSRNTTMRSLLHGSRLGLITSGAIASDGDQSRSCIWVIPPIDVCPAPARIHHLLPLPALLYFCHIVPRHKPPETWQQCRQRYTTETPSSALILRETSPRWRHYAGLARYMQAPANNAVSRDIGVAKRTRSLDPEASGSETS